MAILPKRNLVPASAARKKAILKVMESPVQPVIESKEPVLPKSDILELINRRRRQVIVHSVIYYYHNRNIISDHTFDMWSRELAELQIKYPDVASEAAFAEEFKDFTGATGMQFIDHPWGRKKAAYLLGLHPSEGGD